MRKLTVIIVTLLIITSCKNYLFNVGLKNAGAFDEQVVLTTLIKDEQNKSIICIPMYHYSTTSFYSDVTKKIDSLQKLGYFFYLEGVKPGAIRDDLAYRKLRKINGIPIITSGDDKNMDSLLTVNKLKTKKKLIAQPHYPNLGVNMTKGRNVDVTTVDMIKYYEEQYGEILLSDCDFTTAINTMSTCKIEKQDKKKFDSTILDYRNNIVVQEILNDKINSKIAIIYGKNHFFGIKNQLLENGYKLVD